MNGTRSDREAIRTRHNVTVHGAGEKVLLLAHGFGCDQRMWRLVLPALAARHTVVMFDYVGSGNSELASFSTERYSSLDGYALDVLEIIQAFELEHVTFVGHSVSAMIGLIASLRAPAALVGELSGSFCSTDPLVAKTFARATFFSDHRDLLPRCAVPTLILQSASDSLAHVRIGEYIHRHVSISELEVVEGEGHCLHMTDPHAVATRIETFVG